jgi:hypothetical protein
MPRPTSKMPRYVAIIKQQVLLAAEGLLLAKNLSRQLLTVLFPAFFIGVNR